MTIEEERARVTQADRDAAKRVIALIQEQLPAASIGCDLDNGPMVQAFARHRIAAEQAPATQGVREDLDRLERAVRLADNLTQDVPVTAAALGHVKAAYAALERLSSALARPQGMEGQAAS